MGRQPKISKEEEYEEEEQADFEDGEEVEEGEEGEEEEDAEAEEEDGSGGDGEEEEEEGEGYNEATWGPPGLGPTYPHEGEQLGEPGQPWAVVEHLDPSDDVEPEAMNVEECAHPSAVVPPSHEKDDANPNLSADVEAGEWKSAKEVYGDDMVLFGEGVEPNQINQGTVGDCFFLAAVAALAEDPHKIRKLFQSTRPKPDGGYRIKLYKSGRECVVAVDDFFYFGGQGDPDKPTYASHASGELWVMLLEKAYAKLHGSYNAISGGFPDEALTDLTGTPSQLYETGKQLTKKQRNQMWEYLDSCLDNKYVISLSRSEKKDYEGIFTGHAYSLLQAIETSDGHRLCQVRNPHGWGGEEWHGPWSDGSPKWNEFPEVAEEIEATFEDDGCFWIDFNNFLNAFSSIHICFLSERECGRLASTLNADCTTRSFSLLVDQEDTIFVCAYQEDNRMMAASQQLLKPLTVSIKSEDGEELYSATNCDKDKGVTHNTLVVATDAQPGRYTIDVSGPLEVLQDEERRFVLTVHSGDGVRVEPCDIC